MGPAVCQHLPSLSLGHSYILSVTADQSTVSVGGRYVMDASHKCQHARDLESPQYNWLWLIHVITDTQLFQSSLFTVEESKATEDNAINCLRYRSRKGWGSPMFTLQTLWHPFHQATASSGKTWDGKRGAIRKALHLIVLYQGKYKSLPVVEDGPKLWDTAPAWETRKRLLASDLHSIGCCAHLGSESSDGRSSSLSLVSVYLPFQ